MKKRTKEENHDYFAKFIQELRAAIRVADQAAASLSGGPVDPRSWDLAAVQFKGAAEALDYAAVRAKDAADALLELSGPTD